MTSVLDQETRRARWSAFLAAKPMGQPCSADKREWVIWMGHQGVRIDADNSVCWWSGGPNPHSWGGASRQSVDDFMEFGPVGFGISDKTPTSILREIVYVIHCIRDHNTITTV